MKLYRVEWFREDGNTLVRWADTAHCAGALAKDVAWALDGAVDVRITAEDAATNIERLQTEEAK